MGKPALHERQVEQTLDRGGKARPPSRYGSHEFAWLLDLEILDWKSGVRLGQVAADFVRL
jgi:hypothetical protein